MGIKPPLFFFFFVSKYIINEWILCWLNRSWNVIYSHCVCFPLRTSHNPWLPAHPAALIENTDLPAPMKNGPSAGLDSVFPQPAPCHAPVSSSGSRAPWSLVDHIPKQPGQPHSAEVCVYFSVGLLHLETRGLIFKVPWVLGSRY